MNYKKQTEKEAIAFFEELIELSGTYFLSDYMDDLGEWPEDVITVEDHRDLVKRRDILSQKCREEGIGFHRISCEVAERFLNSQGVEVNI